MAACEAKDGKRQRHPVSVAARIRADETGACLPRRARNVACAPFRRSGRQAARRKGVAIQPGGLRRDVAEAGCLLGDCPNSAPAATGRATAGATCPIPQTAQCGLFRLVTVSAWLPNAGQLWVQVQPQLVRLSVMAAGTGRQSGSRNIQPINRKVNGKLASTHQPQAKLRPRAARPTGSV